MKKSYLVFFLIVVAFMPQKATGQWQVGAAVGVDWNCYSVSKQANWLFDSKAGYTASIIGQYNMKKWLGLRIELNSIAKNNKRRNTVRNLVYFREADASNIYFQIPIMASLSVNLLSKVKLFSNIGVFGGYWLTSEYNYGDEYKKHEFNSKIDERLDYGLVGGIGGEYRFSKHWGCQLEFRYYHSTHSIKKKSIETGNSVYDIYNNTSALQTAILYSF